MARMLSTLRMINFYSRPHGRGDLMISPIIAVRLLFLLAPPREGRLILLLLILLMFLFLLAPPREGRLETLPALDVEPVISTRAPTGGATPRCR